MTDAEDWQEQAQQHADAIRGDMGESKPFDVEDRGTLNPPTALLWGRGRDYNAARKAVGLLQERFGRPLAVRGLAVAYDSIDRSTWAIIVRSPGRPIDDARIEQFTKVVEEAYNIANESE